jgi:hypothetical protein
VYETTATRHERNSQTNYEVHCRTSAGWQFRTIRVEMDDAIAEAKRMLGLAGTEAVRVVRDHYDPATNTIRPNTVFRAATPLVTAIARPALRWRGIAASLAASLIIIGTALTWLHS